MIEDGEGELMYEGKKYELRRGGVVYVSSLIHYVPTKHITKAKQLIRFSGMTMDEIAETVGMNNANYFSRTLRKVEVFSQTEYQIFPKITR